MLHGKLWTGNACGLTDGVQLWNIPLHITSASSCTFSFKASGWIQTPFEFPLHLNLQRRLALISASRCVWVRGVASLISLLTFIVYTRLSCAAQGRGAAQRRADISAAAAAPPCHLNLEIKLLLCYVFFPTCVQAALTQTWRRTWRELADRGQFSLRAVRTHPFPRV